MRKRCGLVGGQGARANTAARPYRLDDGGGTACWIPLGSHRPGSEAGGEAEAGRGGEPSPGAKLGKACWRRYHAEALVQEFTSGAGGTTEAFMAAPPLVGRHFLKLLDFTPAELSYLLDLAATAEGRPAGPACRGRSLAGKSVALIFEKPSTRTRCAFTVACVDEGAHPEYLGKGDIQLGKKETVADTARVLGRMFDGIQFRGFAHGTVEELAAHAGVPVWNGLTDAWHPTQILADVLTVREEFGRLKGIASPTSATAATTSPARSWSAAPSSAWTSGSWRRPRCIPEPELVATVRCDRRRDRGQGDGHRLGRGGGARRPRDLHRRLGLDGRGGQDRRADRPAQGLQGDAPDDGAHRTPRGDLPALPARVPQPGDRRWRGSSRTSARSRTRSSKARSRECSTRPRTACTPSRRSWSRPSSADSGPQAAPSAEPGRTKDVKRVIVFGAGLVVRAHVRYLLDHGFHVTVASRTVEQGGGDPRRASPGNADRLRHRARAGSGSRALVAEHDLAVSLLPWVYHPHGGAGLPRRTASTWSPPPTSRTR